MLNDRLIRQAEGATSRMAPVCGIEAYGALLEGFTCAAEGEETLGVQVGKYKDQDIQRKV
jgi:hypothetical protein